MTTLTELTKLTKGIYGNPVRVPVITQVTRMSGKKSFVFIFNKAKCAVKFPWKIGDQLIPISDKCTHLGTELDARLSSRNRIESAGRRGRNMGTL